MRLPISIDRAIRRRTAEELLRFSNLTQENGSAIVTDLFSVNTNRNVQFQVYIRKSLHLSSLDAHSGRFSLRVSKCENKRESESYVYLRRKQ